MSISKTQLSCPLCDSTHMAPVKNEHRPKVQYYLCLGCDLIFMEPSERPGSAAEKERYLAHQNSSEDLGYVQHLQPILELIEHEFRSSQPSSICGLDYGCGPQPVLMALLERNGFVMSGFDPFFRNDQSVLTNKYDFVVSTEVFEHFFTPAAEIERVLACLKNEGSLFVMTQLHQGEEFFKTWWYPKDLTHVCFYSEKTFQWLAQRSELKTSSDQKSLIHLKQSQFAKACAVSV